MPKSARQQPSTAPFIFERLFNFRSKERRQAYENLSSLAGGLDKQDRMAGIYSLASPAVDKTQNPTPKNLKKSKL